MDRNIVYPGQSPLDTDILTPQVSAMTAIGWLLQAAMGTASGVVGLGCSPTNPASLAVEIAPGAMWSQQEIDTTAFGSLPANASPLMKLGINTAAQTFNLAAPTTAGQSINYLIEATFQESDTDPVALPYYNAANPSAPFTGPNNDGATQNTRRQQIVGLQLVAGVPATAGTQATPAATAGWAALYVVSVAYGQTTVTAADISVAPGAPFMDFFAPDTSTQIANVISGARLTPDRTNTGQLLDAIRKVGLVGGSAGYSSSATLTVADANAIVFFTGASAATFTLPAANAAGAYSAPIVISNQGSAPLTIAAPSGDGTDLPVSVLQPDQVCALINDGSTEWHHLWAENGTSGQFLTGRLGVGTTAPAYEMDVVGQVRFVTDNTGGPGSGTLIVQDQGANGANIVMNGNVISGQPETKYLRVLNGNFEIINNAYSAQILGLDDSGNLSVAGKITGGAYASGADDAVLLGQFNVSNSAGSGYAVLPNGLILQWGNQVLGASNTSYTFNFPIAFPNACVGFGTATKSLSAPTTSALGSVLSNSQYSLTNNSTIANAPQFWFAIGY